MRKIVSVAALLACLVCACSAGNDPNSGTVSSVAGEEASGDGKVTVKGQTYSGAQDLSRLLQPDKKGQRPIRLEFENCTFKGKVSFGPIPLTAMPFMAGVSFSNCIFEEEIDAGQIQFMGGFTMKKCRLKKQAGFQNATFMGALSLRECSFDGDAAFQNALFMREANFMDSHFFAYTLFQEARFMSKALFGNAIFHQNADFTLVRFMDAGQFDYGKFMGRADFTGSRLEGSFSIRQVQAGQIVLRQVMALAPVTLMQLTLKDSTITEGAFFLLGPPKR